MVVEVLPAARSRSAAPDGFELWRGPSSIDGADVVVVVTHLRGAPLNRKIGDRAVALARMASRAGYLPVVPHLPGFHGIYGDSSDSAESRQTALAAGLALLDMVKAAGGELWVIKRDDGTLSAGCRLELDRWLLAPAGVFRARRWELWASGDGAL